MKFTFGKEGTMSKKTVTGQDLNRWRYDHGFVAGTAAECFGIQKAKWEALVRSDEIITDVRIINIYNMYTLYPETIPVPPSFDYIGLFNELGFSNNMKGKTEFARLFGLSVTGTYRIMDKNSAGRDIEVYAQALKRTGKKGKELLSLMQTICSLSERAANAGKENIAEKKSQKNEQSSE